MCCFFIKSGNDSVSSYSFNLTKLGQFQDCSFAYDVQVIDNIAYIADASDGFWILNVSDLTNPIVLSHKLNNGVEHCVYVDNNIALIADYFNGLMIFNVLNPNNPIKIGEFVNGNQISNVVREENIACIGDPFLSILNISDLTHPIEIYRNEDLPVIDLIIKDDILFCLELFQGLTILNISNPASPVEINHWYTTSVTYREMEIYNDVIFMASSNGIKALNINTLTNIQDLGLYSSGNEIISLEIRNSLLYTSESSTNLAIYNISDFDNFEKVGQYTESEIRINSIFVANEIIYATAESNGLLIIEDNINTNEAYSAPFFLGLISLTIICSKVLKKKANVNKKN